MMGSSPIATIWVFLYSIAVGLFACLAFAWAVIAFVNRGNRRISFASLTVVVMLVLVLISFFAADLFS
jgi:predicted PurR-regulated permease PerM